MTHTTQDLIGSGTCSPRIEGQEPSDRGESELVARARAGDDCAWEVLVRQHAGRMLAVARRLLRSEEDSADAVQDAFLSAFRARQLQGQLSPGDLVAPYRRQHLPDETAVEVAQPSCPD